MKEQMKFILIKGAPVWILLIGGMLMVAGGINETSARNIFAAIKQTWGSGWTEIGAIISFLGAALGLMYIIFAIKNIFNK